MLEQELKDEYLVLSISFEGLGDLIFEEEKTFYSVILAGVYDIKNLKLKIRQDDEKKYNSPWNIAVNFNVDMSFSSDEISTMLKEYSEDKNVTINIKEISKIIHFYTNGYPFLVSRLCQIIDEN